MFTRALHWNQTHSHLTPVLPHFNCFLHHSNTHTLYTRSFPYVETQLSCSFCRCRFSRTLSCTVVTDILQSTHQVGCRPQADSKYLPSLYTGARRSAKVRASQSALVSFSEIWHERVTGWSRVQCLTVICGLFPGRRALLLPWACAGSAGLLGRSVHLPRPAVSPVLKSRLSQDPNFGEFRRFKCSE